MFSLYFGTGKSPNHQMHLKARVFNCILGDKKILYGFYQWAKCPGMPVRWWSDAGFEEGAKPKQTSWEIFCVLHPCILGGWEMPVQLLLRLRQAGRAMVIGGMPVKLGEGGKPNLKPAERFSLCKTWRVPPLVFCVRKVKSIPLGFLCAKNNR